jgi:hypothetical protein
LLALVTAQFLIATEILATMTVFGALTLAAAWSMGEPALRRRIAGLAAPILFAYLEMAILVSPYLYYLFAGFHAIPIYSTNWHSSDLLNFVVPTRTIALGSAIGLFRHASAGFTSNVAEQAAYVGLPLLAIAIWFVLERRRMLEARLLGLMLMVTAVASMGPRLHVAGRSYFKLPWSLLHHAPLIDQALPLRFTVYLFPDASRAHRDMAGSGAPQQGRARSPARWCSCRFFLTRRHTCGPKPAASRRRRSFLPPGSIGAISRRARSSQRCRTPGARLTLACYGRRSAGCTFGWLADIRHSARCRFSDGPSCARPISLRQFRTRPNSGWPLPPATK